MCSVYRCVCVWGVGGGGGGQEVEVTFSETVAVERGYSGAISNNETIWHHLQERIL